MAMIGWLVAFVIFIGIEAGTMALTTIWFAGGSLAAFLAALLGCRFRFSWCCFFWYRFCFLFSPSPLLQGL